MSKWTWTGIIAVIAAVYAWFLGINTMFWAEAQYTGRQVPLVKTSLAKLTDTSISPSSGPKLSFLGYEFDNPLGELDRSRTKAIGNTGNLELITFRAGNEILFHRIPPNAFVKTVKETSKLDDKTFREVYGAGAESDYVFERIMLQITPQQLTILTPRKQLVVSNMLLIMKALAPPAMPFFDIQGHGVRGFQYGDPAHGTGKLVVDLFDDTSRLEFIFACPKGATCQPITQPQLNLISQTLHKIPEPIAADIPAAKN